MREVSENYNPFPVVRSPGVTLTFQKLAIALPKNKITVSSSAPAVVNRSKVLVDGINEIGKKYATLERYGWNLDGSCSIMPESGAERGVWYNRISTSSGKLSSSITLTCTLPVSIETLGWTFHFDDPTGIYSPRVQAICYNANDEEIDNFTGTLEDHTRDGEGWWLTRTVAQYKKVSFKFTHLNEGYRYFRMAEIEFGIARSFDTNSIASMSITQEATLDGSALPAKKLVFEFDNSKREFNLLNPVEVYQFWRSGQGISAAVTLGDDSVDMGLFFVSRAEIGKNSLTAKVTAYDEVLQLGSALYDPGDLAQSQSVTLRTAVESILNGYMLEIDCNGLDDEPVSLQIEPTHEKRSVLALVAQAARATVWIDRDSTVQIVRPAIKQTADAELTADQLYDWRGVEFTEEVKSVTLTVSREVEGADMETYTAGSAAYGENTAEYSNPCVAPGKGQDVADWLLVMANWAKRYAVRNRCDPAVEIGDTLKIADVFGNNENAFVTGLDVSFNGTLSANTKAAGEFNA